MTDAIRAYYNDLTRSKMASYHTSPNLRVQQAVAFVLSHVQPTDCVFEIGCGVGVLTKALAAHLSHPTCRAGWLYAVDLSDDAIACARSYVSQPNVVIERADVLSPDFEPRFVRPPTTVILPDTLEHLPRDRHVDLFYGLSRVCAEHAQILITLPSPEYQAFLTNHSPGELQPIDLSISADDLEALAHTFGGRLDSYTLIDTWRARQYVHARIVR
jgi:trans-aconitate methyltransferase